MSGRRYLVGPIHSGQPADALVAHYALFHLEADLRWNELAGARLERLKKEIRR